MEKPLCLQQQKKKKKEDAERKAKKGVWGTLLGAEVCLVFSSSPVEDGLEAQNLGLISSQDG